MGKTNYFELFWLAWPRKVSKLAAQKSWEKLNPDQDLSEIILLAVEQQKKQKKWQEKKFIPHPSRS